MFIGACRIELLIPGSDSLKTKRVAVQSLKTRIKNKFNVSVAEVGNHDLWQRCSLGIAVVSNETRHINQILSKIMDLVESDARVLLLDYSIEFK